MQSLVLEERMAGNARQAMVSSQAAEIAVRSAEAWLVAEDRVVASLEVADTRAARRRGLLGRDGIDIQCCSGIKS